MKLRFWPQNLTQKTRSFIRHTAIVLHNCCSRVVTGRMLFLFTAEARVVARFRQLTIIHSLVYAKSTSRQSLTFVSLVSTNCLVSRQNIPSCQGYLRPLRQPSGLCRFYKLEGSVRSPIGSQPPSKLFQALQFIQGLKAFAPRLISNVYRSRSMMHVAVLSPDVVYRLHSPRYAL